MLTPEETKKMLIAELDPRILMNIELIARDEDIEVITSKDGIEAFKLAQTDLPNLIMISTNLPGMSAFNMCRLLKFDFKYKDMKVIILANTMSREFEEKAEKAGADQLLIKPLTDNEVLAHIQKAIGRCRWKGQKVLWMETR